MKPRELSREECISLLSQARFGRLGLCRGDRPYVIPISYVYSDGKIYLHSRPGGRKSEVVAENSNVCFEIDVLDRERWSSVLAFGRARISSGLEAKERMFAAFTGREMKGHGGKAFRREDLEKMEMSIWEIDIEEMTGREGIW